MPGIVIWCKSPDLCGFIWLQVNIEQFLEGLDPIPVVVDNADDGTDSSDFDTEESCSESESEVRCTLYYIVHVCSKGLLMDSN